jgi:hypothetical protein
MLVALGSISWPDILHGVYAIASAWWRGGTAAWMRRSGKVRESLYDLDGEGKGEKQKKN